MTRRKIEFVRLTNEQDFPHLVELALPPGGFRDVLLQIDAFHRERCRRGWSRYEVKPFYIRFCFPDIATCRCISQSLRWRLLVPRTSEAQAPELGDASDALVGKRGG
jgi:hypothetical protein